TQESSLFRFFRLAQPNGERAVPTSSEASVKRREGRSAELSKLGLRSGAHVFEVNRTRLIDGEPMVIERIVVPAALFSGLEKRVPLPNALYQLYQRDYGYYIVTTEEQLRADLARKEDVRRLKLALGAPLLHIERVGIALDGTRVEWRVSRCDTSKLVYAVTLS
ncbi:MAG: GntR family transcriptional regulator, partial [Steroidobacteraceae bacterium]